MAKLDFVIAMLKTCCQASSTRNVSNDFLESQVFVAELHRSIAEKNIV